MLNFIDANYLPNIWAIIILTAVLLYVLLDGFSLGIGILFPFAPSKECQNKMINSIAPFWDGNETWLVLGGGGLFAVFPAAYSVILPAMYTPILFMLVSLIFRGVAFEFRFKAGVRGKKFWDFAFHFGSLFATFMQGLILGGLVQGIELDSLSLFGGGDFDWVSGFSFMTGLGMVAGYSLLGATWAFFKTEGATQEWAGKASIYSLIHMLLLMGLVCVWMPYIDQHVFERWFTFPESLYFFVVPFGILFASWSLVKGVCRKCDLKPFVMALLLFLLGFLGLIINFWPYVIPKKLTFSQAASCPASLRIMLIACIIVLPVILMYIGYCYYVFRGKVKSEDMYENH